MTKTHQIRLKDCFNRRMLICIVTGMSSGLPLYILISLIPAWLRTEGISLKEIGLFSLIGLPYSLKFLWAPLIDRYTPSIFFGNRKSWMLTTQLFCVLLIGLFGFFSPTLSLSMIVMIAVGLAIFSATQDIVLDAYRRELLSDLELGLGNAIHVNAYRIAGLIPGSLGLILSSHTSWQIVFFAMAFFMLPGIIMSLMITKPPQYHYHSSILQAFIDPAKEMLQRKGLNSILLLLSFMILYKLGDNMATALSTPFYIDMGFTREEIGIVAKNAALWPMMIGGILGGVIILKIGINRALWLFGWAQCLAILGFALLAVSEKNTWLLTAVISSEYFGIGLGTSAFTAFIARESSLKFAATQIALLTAFASIPRNLASAVTGFLAESIGWSWFFIVCALIALPGIFILHWVAPWNAPYEAASPDQTTTE